MHDRTGVVVGVVLVLRDVTVEVRADEERARSSKLESLGIQLFEKIDGDFFSILGLPLLPLLDALRREGAIEG